MPAVSGLTSRPVWSKSHAMMPTMGLKTTPLCQEVKPLLDAGSASIFCIFAIRFFRRNL